MTSNFKKALLLGTALVAVAAVGNSAHAANLTVTSSATWASAGGRTSANIANAVAADNVDITTGAATLTITNDATASDTAAVTNTFVLGNVTDTGAGVGTIAITTGAAADLTVTIADAVIDAAFAITGDNGDNAAITVTVTDDLAIGTTFGLVANEASADKDFTLNVTDDLTVTGASTITSADGDGAGSSGSRAILDVNGDAVFTDAVTVTATGEGDVNMNFAGDTTFTAGLTIQEVDSQAEGIATLTFDGTAAQTVAGTINGATAAEGQIVVANSQGVTFTGIIGGSQAANLITVSKTGAASSATFKANVSSTATVLGNGGGTDTNTVNYDGTTAGFTVAGTVNGTASDTDNVNILGGNTIIQSGIWGGTSGLDNLNISGTGTILDSNAAITTLASTGVTTIGSGATLDVGSGLLTSPSVVNSGTLLLSGTGGVTGAITGTGLLDVNASASVTGAVTQGTADIAAVTLTQATTAAGYTVGSTNFSGAGTLALLGGTQTVTGNFTNTTDGTGTVSITDVSGTTTIVGNLGASTTHSLAALSMGAGATAQTVTTTGNLYVDAVTLRASDTLQFLGTSAQTVSGTIAGVGAGQGILTIGNGTTTSDVTFSGIIGGTTVASATVSAAAIARFDNDATLAGALTNTGSSYVAVGKTVSADSLTDTGAYYLTANDANGTLAVGDFGRLTDSSAGSTIANAKLNFNVTGDLGASTSGTTLTSLLTGVSVGTSAAAIEDNSVRYSFVATNNGGNVDVVVTKVAATAVGNSTRNDNAFVVLDAISTTSDAQLSVIIDNVSARQSDAANEVIEATLPSVDAGGVAAAFDASVQSLGVTTTRLASLRDGSGQSGMVAGDMSNGLTTWFQPFGTVGTQDKRDGVDGYDSNTYGIAVGIDTSNAADDATVGLALSYANTNVDSENSNRTDTDVDSYQVSLYGDYDLTSQTYISGALGYAMNSIDQKRHDVGAVSGLTASADYDSNQYIAYTEVGHKMDVADRTTLTPSVLAHYQHISVDNYTETGAGGANLRVDNDSTDVFELGVGAELAWDLKSENGGKVRPAVNVGYRHDLIGDNTEASSSFTGGGATFVTEGVDPAQGKFNIGASLGYEVDSSVDVTAAYNYDVKQDYDAHSGFVRVGYKF